MRERERDKKIHFKSRDGEMSKIRKISFNKIIIRHNRYVFLVAFHELDHELFDSYCLPCSVCEEKEITQLKIRINWIEYKIKKVITL